MVDSPLGLTVVFNGLHLQLPSSFAPSWSPLGHRFFSTSDTEVIGKAYAVWGLDCVDHFLGMFAFAIFEHATGQLILGRDRLGIKPLYLDQTPDRLRFASTLPALLAGGGTDTEIDQSALAYYMTFHCVVPAPLTILNGRSASCRRPPSGSSSRTASSAITSTGLRSSPATRTSADWTERTGRTRCWSQLRTAVDRRMVADVPVGVLLSGGIDSIPRGGAAGRGRPARPEDVQHRLRLGRRRVRRRVRVLDPGRGALRHRPPPDQDRQLAAAARASTRPSRR